MKVYPGTSTRSRRSKSAAPSGKSSNTFFVYLTTLTTFVTVIGVFGLFFMFYMSLIQESRNIDQRIENVKNQIADTNRSIKTLEDEYAKLSNLTHISAKIRQFRLPLVAASHHQIRNREMEILTPQQAMQIRLPENRPVSVAQNNSRQRY